MSRPPDLTGRRSGRAPPRRGRPESADRPEPRRASRRGAARAVAALLAAGAIGVAVALGWPTLTRSAAALGHLRLGWFLIGLCCEAVSLTAFGLSRRRLLRADGHRARLGSVMAITYAGNALSMAVPFAGAELALVFTYREFRRRGLDAALTGWALAVSGVASSSALALILVAGALLGGRPLVTAFGLAGAAVFGLPGLTVLLALRWPRARSAANRVLAWLVQAARRPLRRPGLDPGTLEAFLARLGGIRLGGRGYVLVFGFAVLNWLADSACLAFAVLAASGSVPWHALLLIYGAGAAVGSTGVTPGGFGLVEVALTAALTASGLAATTALTAVLAYRLLNFWLILLVGGITAVVLSRTGTTRPYTRPDAAAEGTDMGT